MNEAEETKEKVQHKKQKVQVKRLEEVAALKAEIEGLKEKLTEKQKMADEYLDHLQRLQAEFENHRKRMIKEQTKILEIAKEDLIVKLLPVVDNFERAIAALEENRAGNNKILESTAVGVKMILKQLRDILEREGIEEIKAAGERFDPYMHEAIDRVETDEYPDDTVIEEVEKGYLLTNKVIRPSKVKVAKSKSSNKETKGG